MIKKIILSALLVVLTCSVSYGASRRLAKYGVQLTIDFEVYEVDGVDLRTDWVPAQADCEIMKDEGASTLCDNTATDEGSTYSVVLTATEMQFARGVLKIEDAATKAFLDSVIIIETYGNASALHAFDLGTASVPQSADNDTKISTLITGVELNADAITAAKIADNAIATEHIATGAITADSIATAAITADAIATDAIGALEIAADAIGASELATDAIGAAEIAADAIGSSEIATAAIDADAIATDAIGSAELAASAATKIVNDWETQSQADPTGFHVNVLEVAGTSQTANDNGADINTLITQIGTAGDGLTDITLNAASIDLVWDEVISKAAHNVSGSAAKVLRMSGDITQIDGAVSDVSPTVTGFDTDLTQADGFFDDAVMIFGNGAANAGVGRPIVTYLNASGAVTFLSPDDWAVTPVNGDDFTIFATHIHPVSQIADAVLDEATSGHDTIGTLGAALNNQNEIILTGAASGTHTTTTMQTDLTVTVNDQYNGRIITFTSDTATVALRNQQTDITDTVTTNSEITFTALTTAPSDGDKFVIN